jgi:Peptidase family M28
MSRTQLPRVRFKTPLMLTCFAGILANCGALAQDNASTPPAADPRIAAALREVSADHIRANIQTLVGFGNRSTLSAQDPASISAGRGIGAAREWIKAEFGRYSAQCGGCLQVKTDEFTQPSADRVPQSIQIVNVYAVLQGTDPESAKRIILVTGHYDSRNSDNLNTKDDAPGANDDASGTAVSLECARVLSMLKFPATIIFLAVAGEEQGLYGSEHFAEMARQQNWTLEAVLNNDIVGGDKSPGQDPTSVRIFSEGLPLAADDKQLQRIRRLGNENDSPSRELARYIANTGALYDIGLHPTLVLRLDRFLRGGDHSAFNEKGFAAVRFTEFHENFDRQHQNVRQENGVPYGDLLQFVDFDYVARVARLNAATLATLASAPAPPANVKLDVSKLDNDSTLTWEASPGGRVASYEIVWRPTNSSNWEFTRNVGTALRATVPVSKDNVIFGVRAVDSDGHRSPAVLPEPAR